MLEINYTRNDVEKYLKNTSYPPRLVTVALLHLAGNNQSEIARRIGMVHQGVNKIIRQCQELILWHQRLDQYRPLEKHLLMEKKITEIFPSHWEVTRVLGNANRNNLYQLLEAQYGDLIRYRNMGPGSVIRLNSVLSFLGCQTIEPDENTLPYALKQFITAYYCTTFKLPLSTSKVMSEVYEKNKWGLIFAKSLGEKKLYPPPCFFLKTTE